jgi:hypothetical protein
VTRHRLLSLGFLGVLLACGAAAAPGPPRFEPRASAPVALRDTSGESSWAAGDTEGPAPAVDDARLRPRSILPSAPPAPSGRPIDLDVRGADIQDVCRLIAEVAGVGIVVSDDVRGAVTVRLKKVPWDQALEAIAAAKGFRVERSGAVILVRAGPR